MRGASIEYVNDESRCSIKMSNFLLSFSLSIKMNIFYLRFLLTLAKTIESHHK